MCKNARKSCSLAALLLFLFVAPAFAAQAPAEISPAEALNKRVMLYYGALLKGAKTAALDLVAPESKNDFARMNYAGLNKFRILQVNLSDAGDTAKVLLLRTDSFVGFPQLLDHETSDTWKRINGQWYVVLPAAGQGKELDTPFGKMIFAGRDDSQPQATPLPGSQNMVSPEQAMRALQRAMVIVNKQKPGDQEKKSGDQPAPKQDRQN